MESKRENAIKVAYCGAQGSFSRQAAKALYPQGELIPSSTFREAYEKVQCGEADRAVLPLENSYAGEVAATMDLLYRGKLQVSDVYDMRVVQNLVGIKGTTLADVRSVISHPQALAQCAEYIAAKRFQEITTENTAFAAKTVADKASHELAAIASKECAEIYGLEVIAEDVAESHENTTRFAVFTKTPPAERVGERLIILFTVSDRSGALLEALKIIAEYGYNMKSLHSRPLKDKPWQYYFYVEAEGSGEEAFLLRDLNGCCTTAKLAGRFLPDQKI